MLPCMFPHVYSQVTVTLPHIFTSSFLTTFTLPHNLSSSFLTCYRHVFSQVTDLLPYILTSKLPHSPHASAKSYRQASTHVIGTFPHMLLSSFLTCYHSTVRLLHKLSSHFLTCYRHAFSHVSVKLLPKLSSRFLTCCPHIFSQVPSRFLALRSHVTNKHAHHYVISQAIFTERIFSTKNGSEGLFETVFLFM